MDSKAALVSVLTGAATGVIVTIVLAELLASTVWLAILVALPLGVLSFVIATAGTYRYLVVDPPSRDFSEYDDRVFDDADNDP